MARQELIDAELKTYADALHDFLWRIDGVMRGIADWLHHRPVLGETLLVVVVTIFLCGFVISIINEHQREHQRPAQQADELIE